MIFACAQSSVGNPEATSATVIMHHSELLFSSFAHGAVQESLIDP